MLVFLNRLLCTLALVLALESLPTYAQTPAMVQYTSASGLPSNMVYDVVKDKKGFLWFATDMGIARFNGLNFERFTTFDGMADNEALIIQEDFKGRLWIGCYNGDLCYYQNGRFHSPSNTRFLQLPFKSEPKLITVTYDSSLIFRFNDRKVFVNIKDEEVKIYNFKKMNPEIVCNDSLLHINKLNSDQIELIYANRRMIIDTAGNILKTVKYNKNSFYGHVPGSSPNEYLYATKGIYNIFEDLIFPLTTPLKPQVREVLRVKVFSGVHFICTQDGLLINNKIRLLGGKQVSSIERDIAGNYWISTLKNGVFKMTKDYLDILMFNEVYQGRVLYAESYAGNLFISSTAHKGIKQVPLISAARDLYSENSKNQLRAKRFFSYGNAQSIVTSKLSNSNNLISVGLNLKMDRIIRHVYSFGNTYYIVSYRSIICFKLSNNGSIIENSLSEYFINASGKKILGHAIDKDNNIWCSTIEGVYRFKNKKVERISDFKHVFRKMQFMGDYLIGITDKNTMVMNNRINGKMVSDSVMNTDCIWDKIYPIDNTHALISTNNHYRLLTLKPSDNKPIYAVDIIENRFIPKHTEFVSSDELNCYFFKDGNVTLVAKDKLFAPPSTPSVYFIGIKTTDKIYSTDKTVIINYDEAKSISINFRPISFDREQLKFEFLVTDDGGTGQWNSIVSNELNLYNVSYGVHIVKVRVSGQTGVSYTDEFILEVRKPFWIKWWFIGLVCILALAAIAVLIWLSMRYVLRKRKAKFESEKKYQRSEYKALNALMNPHFIFNSLNNIQGLINDDNKESANQYLSIFSQLVRQNMHNISKELITVEQEMILVRNYLNLEKLRFKQYVNFTINIDEDVEIDNVLIPPLLIQPLVENSVKHGILPQQSPDSVVNISVFEKGNQLFIVVTDNGVGITAAENSKSALHDSTGIANILRRMEHLKALHKLRMELRVEELYSENGMVEGSRSTVIIDLD